MAGRQNVRPCLLITTRLCQLNRVAQAGTVSSVDEEKPFPINRMALGRVKLCYRLTQGSQAPVQHSRSAGLIEVTFAREPMCGIEQQSSKRRQVDQSSSRSRSSREAPLKPGCQCSVPLAPDISSQAGFMKAPTYPPANMHGWCFAGSKASA